MAEHQKMRQFINISRAAADFPADRSDPEPTAQELCAPLYERLLRSVEAWIDRGRGTDKLFYAPPLCQHVFKAHIAEQLEAQGFAIQYLPEQVRVYVPE